MVGMVLYAIAVVTLAAGLIRISIARQREFRVAQQQLQADFLLTAGMSRAESQLERSGQYRGETWRCEVPGADGRVSVGKIEISVAPVSGSANSGQGAEDDSAPEPTAESSAGVREWEITVAAEYPVQASRAVRRHRTWHVSAVELERGEGVSE